MRAETTVPLWLVDAFVGRGCLGNPAGVCLVPEFPNESVMQHLAYELHWSETAFLKKVAEDTFHLRWFAPEDEAPICGHATLAAAHFLFQRQEVKGDIVHFQSKAGSLSVRKESGSNEETDRTPLSWLTMDFPACPLAPCEDGETAQEIQRIIGSVRLQKLFKDPLIFVALLASEEDVARCQPDLALLAQRPCRALAVTAKATTPGFDFVSRYFAPRVGIPEDPVCGSAHCRLAPFWAKIVGKTSLLAFQASRRGGLLRVRYDEAAGRVFLSGQARTVMRGEILGQDLVKNEIFL